jgi:Type I phosphodiesterase / nucleotide pyrophosphatase
MEALMRSRSVLVLASVASFALAGCGDDTSTGTPDSAPDSFSGPDSGGDGSSDAAGDGPSLHDATVDAGGDAADGADVSTADVSADTGRTDAQTDTGLTDSTVTDSGAIDSATDSGATDGADAAPTDAGPIALTQRVLLISVDGLHQVDLTKYIAAKPTSTLAKLAATGVQYTAAHTTTPSDSFPGLLSFVTGGTPKTHGVYYDDSYDRTLYPPPGGALGDGGVDLCSGTPGTEVVYDESIDYDDSKVFSGGINPANLPHRKDINGNCRPVYPHEFLKTNTIFEVIKAAGHYTAWSDKHPAYDLVNGPSGQGVDDLFTPEINSLIANGGTVNGVDLAGSQALCDSTNSLGAGNVTDFTTCLPAVQAYDDTKVQAIVNEIDGKTSDGSAMTSVPTIFGMNFQQVSVGEKLPVGGYADATGAPSAVLQAALDHVDASLGRMVAELTAKNLLTSTLIIVSAKHGQSPIDRSKLVMERDDAGLTDPSGDIKTLDPTVDTAVSVFINPNSGSQYSTHGHFQTDDVGLLWLQDQSTAAAIATKLGTDLASIHADMLPSGTIFSSSVVSGATLHAIYGDPTSNPVAAARAPDVVIQPNAGVIYSGSSKKIAEHGGGSPDDTHVALLISLPGLAPQTVTTDVTTTQVAPTILKALRIDPALLQAVVKESTPTLTALF